MLLDASPPAWQATPESAADPHLWQGLCSFKVQLPGAPQSTVIDELVPVPVPGRVD